MPNKPDTEQLIAENLDLHTRLEKAEATLSEILSGEADALFVTGVAGAQLFTLKGADQSYRTLIENMSEGALTLTPDGLILYANQRFAGMLGTPLEKVIGSEIHNWFAQESRQIIQALLQKEAIDKYHEELNLATPDGTQVPVYLSVSRLVLHEIPGSVCMVVTDLTEQKRNEAILAAEKLSNAILEQAADAIVICDETGRIMRASKQAHAIYGKNPVGQIFGLAFPLRQSDGTALSVIGTTGTTIGQSIEARLECNGQGFDLLVSVGYLKGMRDELLGSVVTLTDITERKIAELALQKNERQLSEALIIARIGYWEYEFSTDEFIFNDQYYSLHKITAEEAGGYRMTSAEFAGRHVYPEDASKVGQHVRLARDTLDPDYFAKTEVRILSGAGEIIWVDVRFRIEKDLLGNTIKLIGVNQDITDRKQSDIDLRWRTAFFDALVKTSVDGILVVDSQGKKMLQNRRLTELFKIPQEIAANPDDNLQLQFVINQVVDAGQFGDKVRFLYGHPEETSRDEVALKNGTVLERYSAPVLDGGGHSYGRIWSFHDITARKHTDESLKNMAAKYHTMFEKSADAIMLLNEKGFFDCNEATLRMFGCTARDEFISKHPAEFSPPAQPGGDDSMSLANQHIATAIKNGSDLFEWRHRRFEGAEFSAEVLLTAMELDGKSVLQAVVRDITERKISEARIRYLSRVHAVLSGINALIVRVIDRDELFREACQIAVEKGGFRMGLVVIVDPATKKVVSIVSAGKDEELLSMIKDRLITSDDVSNTMVGLAISGKQPVVSNDSLNDPRLVFSKRYADSGVHSLAILPLVVTNEVVGTISLYAGEIEFFHEEEMKLLTELAGDIAFAIDHIGKQEKLNYFAYYDVLTGLANRSLFFDRVAQYIHSAVIGGHKLAIGLIDLERFKNINDSLGRTAGDILLKQVAEWLTQFTRDTNLLARIDADHFAFVVPEVKTDGNLAKLVDKLMTTFLEHPFRLNNTTFRIGIKVGISVFPDDGSNIDTLFNNAEAALKKAKSSGDRYLFYTQKMSAAVAGKLTLENQLRQAIDNEEFVLYYQPKVNLVSGNVTSAEALIRWNDPRTGLVPPGKFIPILEETGLIYEVGRWALRKAIEDYQRWRAMGLPAVRIAVNVSPMQLRNPGFVADLESKIAFDAHAADGLELEITESLVMEDVQYSIDTLKAIRAMGITIAIDDFGTGFSSLSYLARLPVDTLKIDRSFVIEMDAPEGLALVSTIIMVAHALKLKVVAEGVETEKQSRQLLSLNCDEMQGFLFSKPVPAEIFEARFLAQLPVE